MRKLSAPTSRTLGIDTDGRLLQPVMPKPVGAKEPPGPLPPGIWKVASVAIIGSFMAQLDATVVNVSLASLATQLHSNLSTIQWTMSGYLLALALLLPLSGWLVGRLGAKALYLWCFAAFTLSSALCGLAWSAGSLIGFRILQGMSAGLLAPMAQLMVARMAGQQMPRVMSFVTAPILLAPLLGPVLAGAILQYTSWRWLFLINLPIGLLGCALAIAFLPDNHGETKPRPLDLVGFCLLSPGLVLFLYGADHIGTALGGSALAGSVIMLALYAWTARKKGDAALVDLRLFKGSGFSVAVASMFMVYGAAFAGQLLIPIYLVRACGLSPGQTGLLLVSMGLGSLCTFPFLGRLTDRFGIRKVAVGGALLALAGTAPLIFLAHYGLIVAVLVVGLFARGVGISAIGIPANSSGYASVPRQDLPMAATAMNIGQRLGPATLTMFCVTFLDSRLARAHDVAATAGAFVAVFALLCFLHGILLLITLRLPWTLAGRSGG